MLVLLRVTLIVAALLHAGPLFAQTAFKYKFKAGETLRYELTIAHKGATKVDDKEVDGAGRQVITMTWKVQQKERRRTRVWGYSNCRGRDSNPHALASTGS